MQDIPLFPPAPDFDIFGDTPHLEYARGALPVGPRERSVPTYATTENLEIEGEPVKRGMILFLKLGEETRHMQFSLHVHGFSLRSLAGSEGIDAGVDGGEALSCLWSPFSLVEKCHVKRAQHCSAWAVFKLTVYRTEGDDRVHYFATSGSSALEERDIWVAEISNCISQVAASLFPRNARLQVEPLPGVSSTSTRIMAGYMLRCLVADNVSLFYCELHAYSGGHARLSIHKDEWCEREVMSVPLSDRTVVSSGQGDSCAIFGIDAHRFCARTREEKELWLRAVSNVKVKLMFDAPDPTREELSTFRAAVGERIMQLTPGLDAMTRATKGPLLPPMPRLPLPASPRGDDLDGPDSVEPSREDCPVAPPEQLSGNESSLGNELPLPSSADSSGLRLAAAAPAVVSPAQSKTSTGARLLRPPAECFGSGMDSRPPSEDACSVEAETSAQTSSVHCSSRQGSATATTTGVSAAAVAGPCPAVTATSAQPCHSGRCEADIAAGEGEVGVLVANDEDDSILACGDAPKVSSSLDIPARRCMCRNATSRILGVCARRRCNGAAPCEQPCDV